MEEGDPGLWGVGSLRPRDCGDGYCEGRGSCEDRVCGDPGL